MHTFIQGLITVPPLVAYAFTFLWLAAESCGFPLPNELVLLLLGSLIEQRNRPEELVLLALIATAGSLTGATAAYFIGQRGGRAAVLRIGRYLRLNEARLNSVERWFSSSGGFAIGLARITPFVRTVSSFPAGVLRLPLRTFLLATTIGSLLWCATLVTIGYVLGADYMIAVNLIETYTLPTVAILLALAAGYIWLHQRLSRTEQPAAASQSINSGPTTPHGATAKSGQAARRVSRAHQRPQR